MESVQACAVSVKPQYALVSEGDFLNMFGPVSELDEGKTQAAAFWAAALTITILGNGRYAPASLACMLCPSLSFLLLSSVFCSMAASLLHCLVSCRLKKHMSLPSTRPNV